MGFLLVDIIAKAFLIGIVRNIINVFLVSFFFKYRYISYDIFSDSEISSLASKTGTRYSANSLFGLMFDVTVLSECDYIICTFSSQVNR